MPYTLRVLSLVLVAVLAASEVHAQGGRLAGRAVESGSLRPLAGARVTIVETGSSATTDRHGLSRKAPQRQGETREHLRLRRGVNHSMAALLSLRQ